MKTFLHTLAVMAVASTAYVADAGPSNACEMHEKMHHHAPKLSKKLRANNAVKSYMNADYRMHQDMNIIYSGNADVDFTRGMIPHHQGAVDMANVELNYGKDPEMRELAQRIVTWQEAEIGFMKNWLAGRTSAWRADNAESLASVQGYIKAMEQMHKDMNIAYTGNADVDFARGMIPHHQGAIDMAWVLKQNGMDPILSKMADDVIRSQGQEIRLMQEWLAKHDVPAPIEHKHKKKHKKKYHHDHASH